MANDYINSEYFGNILGYMDHERPFLFQMSARQIDETLIVDISKTQLLSVMDLDFPPLNLCFRVISLL